MSSGTANPRSSAGTANPLFGIEIEVFLKLKADVARDLQAEIELEKFQHKQTLPSHLWNWDFKLQNTSPNQDAKNAQRNRVHLTVRQCLQEYRLPEGWYIDDDETLDEAGHDVPDRSYWRCEIVTRPMHASEAWQAELDRLFVAISSKFDIWVNGDCSCHVHITPGTSEQAPYYTAEQLARIACATCYWEAPLEQLLPPDRKQNDWAKRNTHDIPGLKLLYDKVPTGTWAPLFKRFTDAKTLAGVAALMLGDARRIKVVNKNGQLEAKFCQKYLSTNFCNVLTKIGTVEFRRQGGVASAELAIKQALLALTLHVSALHTSGPEWEKMQKTKARPTTAAMIAELTRCMALLPPTSQLANFGAWLKQCDQKYHALPPRKLSAGEIQKINTLQSKKRFEATRFATPPSPPTPAAAAATAPVLPHITAASWAGTLSDTEIEANPWA